MTLVTLTPKKDNNAESKRKQMIKRIDLLRNVRFFKSFEDSALAVLVNALTEVKVAANGYVVRQGEEGEEFFIIESGVAVISRVNNLDDPLEEPKELVRLKAKDYFGELALLSSEKRSATVTASESGSLRLLKMSKTDFEDTMAKNNIGMAASMNVRGREIVAQISIFKDLSMSEVDEMLGVMTIMHYKPGSYICQQGDVGNTFHIIIGGNCDVTIPDNSNPGAEIKVAELGEEDYFGEVALMEADNRRTANVVTTNNVTTMCMTRNAFQTTMQKLQPVLMHNAAMKVVATRSKQTLRSDEVVENKDKLKYAARAVVAGLQDGNVRQYFREIIKEPKRLPKPELLFAANGARDLLQMIQTDFENACLREANDRTEPDLKLVVDVSRANNSDFHKNFCKDWPMHQYTTLCRYFKFRRIASDTPVFECNGHGTSVFIVIRGVVSLSKIARTKSGIRETMFVRHVKPGSCFGERVLKGMNLREHTAYALSDVQLLELESSDYQKVKQNGISERSVDEKFQFLKQLDLFKDWEKYKLYRFAFLLTQQIVAKGRPIVRAGTTSNALYLIYNGLVQNRMPKHSVHGFTSLVLTTLRDMEVLGESGILTAQPGHHKVYKEKVDAVADTPVELLVLKEADYKSVDASTMERIQQLRKLRVGWMKYRKSELKAADTSRYRPVTNDSLLLQMAKVQQANTTKPSVVHAAPGPPAARPSSAPDGRHHSHDAALHQHQSPQRHSDERQHEQQHHEHRHHRHRHHHHQQEQREQEEEHQQEEHHPHYQHNHHQQRHQERASLRSPPLFQRRLQPPDPDAPPSSSSSTTTAQQHHVPEERRSTPNLRTHLETLVEPTTRGSFESNPRHRTPGPAYLDRPPIWFDKIASPPGARAASAQPWVGSLAPAYPDAKNGEPRPRGSLGNFPQHSTGSSHHGSADASGNPHHRYRHHHHHHHHDQHDKHDKHHRRHKHKHKHHHRQDTKPIFPVTARVAHPEAEERLSIEALLARTEKDPSLMPGVPTKGPVEKPVKIFTTAAISKAGQRRPL